VTVSTSRTKVVDYNVSAGKDFYVLEYSLVRETDNNAGANPCSLEVETSSGIFSVIDKGSFPDGSNHDVSMWAPSRDVGLKIATAGQTVAVYIEPGRRNSTVWFGKIVGIERDT